MRTRRRGGGEEERKIRIFPVQYYLSENARTHIQHIYYICTNTHTRTLPTHVYPLPHTHTCKISPFGHSDSSIINPCSPEGQLISNSFDDESYDIWLNRRRAINAKILISDLSGVKEITAKELEKDFDFKRVNESEGSSRLDESEEKEKKEDAMLEEPPVVVAVSHLSKETDKPSVHKKKVKIITHLLSLKSNQSTCTVNSFDSSGFGALHWASALGQCEVMRVLYENGADVNIKCKR